MGLLVILVTVCPFIIQASAYYQSTPLDDDGVNNPDSGIFTTCTADASTGRLKIKGESWGFTRKTAEAWVVAEITPSSTKHVKIGFTASSSWHIDTGAGGAEIWFRVVLYDEDMEELDSYTVDHWSIWWNNQASGTQSYSYSTYYTLDGAYTLQSGETYYVGVEMDILLDSWSRAYSYSSTTSPANLAVTRISWLYY